MYFRSVACDVSVLFTLLKGLFESIIFSFSYQLLWRGACGCAPDGAEGENAAGRPLSSSFFPVAVPLRLLLHCMAKLLVPTFSHQSEGTGQERTVESSA